MNPLRNFREGQLVVADFEYGTRHAIVEPMSQHGDALTLVDCTGKELTGEIVSMRGMLPDEIESRHRYESEQAYAAAERAADPDVLVRTVVVLLMAAAMRPMVVTVHGEEARGAA